MTPEYAREGYRFYSVETPSVFVEYELPDDDHDMNERQEEQWDDLLVLAHDYETTIHSSPYRRG
jgi:hypothetical protein